MGRIDVVGRILLLHQWDRGCQLESAVLITRAWRPNTAGEALYEYKDLTDLSGKKHFASSKWFVDPQDSGLDS